MSFKTVKLLDISKPKQWKNLPSSEMTEEGYFVYGANGIIGKYTEYNHEFPTLVITCRGATCGSLHITKPKSYINSNAMALDNLSDDVNIKYLYYALFIRGFKNVITGSAQPQITREGLSKIKIPLPSLSEQIRIAAILTQAENLIKQRKESILLLDELLKSSFLEKFGDEFKNYSKWNTKLSDVISSIDSGWSPLCDTRPRESEKEWAVLKLSCVSNKKFDPTKNKACYPETVIKKELIPKKGDLLFSRKNTFELVGAAAFVFKDYQKLLLPDTIFKISYDPLKISGLYLWYLFNNESFSKQVRSLANGAAGSMPNISMVKLKSLKIPNPPLELQNQFAAIVEKVETLKSEYQASLKELENMYGVLSQKAFKGELRVNKVSLEFYKEVIKTPVAGSVEPAEEVEPPPLVPIAGIHIKDLTLDEYYNIPEEITAKYGSIEHHHENWEFMLKKIFHNSPVDLNHLEEIYNKITYERGGYFVLEDWKTFIFKELTKSKSFLKQKYNTETNQLELLINEIKKS